MPDLIITSADVRLVSDTELQYVQFGEAVTEGDAVYLSTDSKYWKTDCLTIAAANVKGVVMTAGDADGYGYIAYKKGTEVNIGATIAVNKPYVISNTAGKIMPIEDLATTGWVNSLVGWGKTTSNMLLYPTALEIAVP